MALNPYVAPHVGDWVSAADHWDNMTKEENCLEGSTEYLRHQELSGQQKTNLGSLVNILKADFFETDTAYFLYVDLPGILKERIDIFVEGSYLNIYATRAVKHVQTTWKKHVAELDCGMATRRILIPDNVAIPKVSATFESGELKVEMPKASSRILIL